MNGSKQAFAMHFMLVVTYGFESSLFSFCLMIQYICIAVKERNSCSGYLGGYLGSYPIMSNEFWICTRMCNHSIIITYYIRGLMY